MRRPTDIIWLALIVCLTAVATYLSQAADRHPNFFVLDLVQGQAEIPAGLPVELIEMEGQTAVLKVSLDGYRYKKARFEVEYGQKPQGWTVNIGDSQSNNGYGGDGADQTRDCELQVRGGNLEIYGSDALGEADRLLQRHRNIATGQTFTFTVGDEYLGWQAGQFGDEMFSHYLFALSGQEDYEGSPNNDIYAAFNRTIASAGRDGSGVTRVRVLLLTE